MTRPLYVYAKWGQTPAPTPRQLRLSQSRAMCRAYHERLLDQHRRLNGAILTVTPLPVPARP